MRAAAIAAIAAATMLCAGADGGALAAKKREPPAEVAPVTLGGVRYEALHWGRARGLPQNGGYLRAVDPSSGRELWVARVYGLAPGDAEDDKNDDFITTLAASGTTILVETEGGRRYRFDPAGRTARPE